MNHPFDPTSSRHQEQELPLDPARSARRRAREFALQGVYQWLVSQNDAGSILAFLQEDLEFSKADKKHLRRVLEGLVAHHVDICTALQPFLDRPLVELSMIERAALLIGTYELLHCLDIPYKVIINESVEITKVFGSVDGYKYVNGVLDKLAPTVRTHEKE